jgi:hypothetical protein
MKKVCVLKRAGVGVQFGIFHNEEFGGLYKSLCSQNREIWDVTYRGLRKVCYKKAIWKKDRKCRRLFDGSSESRLQSEVDANDPGLYFVVPLILVECATTRRFVCQWK